MKKNFRIILCLTAFAAAVFTSCSDDEQQPVEQATCLPVSLQDGLVTTYTFGSGSLNDGVGTAHLTLSGGVQPGADRDGNPQCAYTFDGQATSYLSTQNASALSGLTEFSVSFWYNPVTGSGQDYQVLISTDAGLPYPFGAGYWSVGLYDCFRGLFSSGHGEVWDGFVTTNNFVSCEDEVAARAGSWHYLTATYSQANNQIKIYHNGVVQQTETLVPNVTAGTVTSLFIGKGFTGTIDDVAIYNKVLTQADIDALFALDACCQ